ncbi:hypothetical protein [Hymenobacter edaphi]|uniref:hypothetical protein n=1 Tax=Hymenobacter edaphi TaxID=2211146 RepID=UPI00105763B0|nr:hypothetical protein [Hymenobacter edaphi]
MASTVRPARPKRGFLWYIGVIAAGAFGLVVLFFVTLVIYAVNGLSPRSFLVSDDENTYLEAVTSNHGEGFLDGYDWLKVYYVHDGWFWNERVLVRNIPHISASDIGFRRRWDRNGKFRIEVKKRSASQDSSVLFVFVPPSSFSEYSSTKLMTLPDGSQHRVE